MLDFFRLVMTLHYKSHMYMLSKYDKKLTKHAAKTKNIDRSNHEPINNHTNNHGWALFVQTS